MLNAYEGFSHRRGISASLTASPIRATGGGADPSFHGGATALLAFCRVTAKAPTVTVMNTHVHVYVNPLRTGRTYIFGDKLLRISVGRFFRF